MISFRTGAVALCAVALISFASCGGSSSSTDDDTTTGTAGGMSGQLTTSDGSALSGAFVGVSETSASSLIKAAMHNEMGHPVRYTTAADDEGDECEEVDGDFLATDCTDSSGNYNITAEVPCGTSLTVTAKKGAFTLSLNVTLTCPSDSDGDGDTEDETVAIEEDFVFDDDCVDDGSSDEDPEEASELVKPNPAYTLDEESCDWNYATMAVTRGYYDEIENVLAKLGFGEVDEFGILDTSLPYFFDLYDDTAETTEDLLSDIDLMNAYDIIFINCGNADESLFETYSGNLGEYVTNGGILYVTDWSYQALEQPFPDFVDFALGSDAEGGTPESPFTAAKIGTGGITTDATVDEDLGEWLDGVTVNDGEIGIDCYTSDETIVNAQDGARNDDGTVTIGDFLGSWVVMDGFYDDLAEGVAVLWASGPIESSLGSDSDAPLTASAGRGDGAIVYSSYHTAHTCPTTGFWPQERILQYLVFE